MKFFHLSDLHIGKSVNGFSMLAEQAHIFAQVLAYIKTHRPDAVLVAGDLYDRPVPGVEAVRLFDQFLTSLAGEGVAVLLISGNHDSPERLGFASRLLTGHRLFISGVFAGRMQKVALPDAHGEVFFWLLPFLRPLALRGTCQGRAIESYDDAISAAIEQSGVDYTARNVLISHQFYRKAGVTPLRSESELDPIGGLDAADAALLEGFDYVALGHLHGGQQVGAPHIRYCGSPLKYSFSECRQQKSLTLVEMGEKGEVDISTLPLTPIHEMREIRGEMEALLREGAASPAGREDYLRVILTDQAEIVDPVGKLRSVYPNLASLDFENSRTGVDLDALSARAGAVETRSLYDLFGEFFLEVQGAAMSEAQAEIVRSLLEKEAAQ